MKHLLLGTLLLVGISCHNQTNEDPQSIEELSNFNLESDYLDFSRKLEEGDTLGVFLNLSICDSYQFENNLLIKRNGKIFLNTVIIDPLADLTEAVLPEVEYSLNSSDTLAYEYLFKSIKSILKENDDELKPRIIISYKTDTLKFYSHSLEESMKMVDQYLNIQQRLYPEVELYKPVIVPE